MVTVTNCTAALFLFIYYNKFCCYSTDNTSDYSRTQLIAAAWKMTPRIVQSLSNCNPNGHPTPDLTTL